MQSDFCRVSWWRLLTEAADLTYAYVPPGRDRHIADEWRPVMESEIEFTNQALHKIEKAGKVPMGWKYEGPNPPLNLQWVWKWFHHKGIINRHGRYLGGHEDLMSESMLQSRYGLPHYAYLIRRTSHFLYAYHIHRSLYAQFVQTTSLPYY